MMIGENEMNEKIRSRVGLTIEFSFVLCLLAMGKALPIQC